MLVHEARRPRFCWESNFRLWIGLQLALASSIQVCDILFWWCKYHAECGWDVVTVATKVLPLFLAAEPLVGAAFCVQAAIQLRRTQLLCFAAVGASFSLFFFSTYTQLIRADVGGDMCWGGSLNTNIGARAAILAFVYMLSLAVPAFLYMRPRKAGTIMTLATVAAWIATIFYMDGFMSMWCLCGAMLCASIPYLEEAPKKGYGESVLPRFTRRA